MADSWVVLIHNIYEMKFLLERTERPDTFDEIEIKTLDELLKYIEKEKAYVWLTSLLWYVPPKYIEKYKYYIKIYGN